jgi:hypothetical protein
MRADRSLQTYGRRRADGPTRWDYFTDRELDGLWRALEAWVPEHPDDRSIRHWLVTQVGQEYLHR